MNWNGIDTAIGNVVTVMCIIIIAIVLTLNIMCNNVYARKAKEFAQQFKVGNKDGRFPKQYKIVYKPLYTLGNGNGLFSGKFKKGKC